MKRRTPSLGCRVQGASSDSSIMASGSPDVMTNQDPAEATEECPGKKKSKFQTFKNFFVKKKRKEAAAPAGDAGLKSSQSSDNVNTPETTNLTHSENDMGSGSKINMGSKAMSHDSVFVSDSPSLEKEGLGASQDSIHGKVKSLQLQLKQAIRLGSPPSLMCVKKADDGGAVSEDDGLPCSPPEYSTLHTVLTGGLHRSSNLVQRNSSLSLEGTDSDEDQLCSDQGSRPATPLVIPPADFSQPATPLVCLDNTAAKHRLAIRHHACNKRKPATRVECRSERDSLQEDRLSVAIPEAVEEREEEDVNRDQAKAIATDEDEDEQTDSKQSQHASAEQQSRSDKEDEQEAGQEVSHGQDALRSSSSTPSSSSSSSPPQRDESDSEECLPAEPHPRQQSQPPSLPSSRPSSVGCLPSLETPAGDFLLEAGAAGGRQEEESSLLQEVLSSLSGPLSSTLGLEMEAGVLGGPDNKEEEMREVDDLFSCPDVLTTRPDLLTVASEPLSPPAESPQQEVLLGGGALTPTESPADLEPASEDDDDVGDEGKSMVECFEPREDNLEETFENCMEEEDPTPLTEERNEGESEEEEALETEEDMLATEEKEEVEGIVQVAVDVVEDEKRVGESRDEEEEESAENTVVLDPEEEEEEDEEALTCVTDAEQHKQLGKISIPVFLKDRPMSLTDPSDPVIVNQTSLDQRVTEQTIAEPEELGQAIVDITILNNSKVGQNILDQSAVDRPVMDKPMVDPHYKPILQPQTETIPPSEEEKDSLTTIQTSPRPSACPKPTLVSSSSEHIAQQLWQAPEEAGKMPGNPEQGKGVRFTIAPAWQRTLSGGSGTKDPKDSPPPSASPSFSSSLSFSPSSPFSPSSASPSTHPVTTPVVMKAVSAVKMDSTAQVEPFNLVKEDVPASPIGAETPTAPAELMAVWTPKDVPPPNDVPPLEETNPQNPFGVRLRKTSTSALLRYNSTSEIDIPAADVTAHIESVEHPKSPAPEPPSQPISSKPALPRKPELQGESGVKPWRAPEPAVSRVPSGSSESPSWIHMARQKQRVFKEHSLEENQEKTVEKEEPDGKASIPVLSSPVRDPAKPGGSPVKVSYALETSKPAVPEREARKALTQPSLPAVAQRPQQPLPGPLNLSPKTQPQPSPKSPLTQRAMSPSTPLPQDEPPWLALAKKKAKAWSEMPQIVQ